MKPRWFFYSAVFLAACVLNSLGADAKIRALVLSSGGNDATRQTSAFLRELLDDCGRFDTRVSEVPSELTAGALKDFNVVIENGDLNISPIEQAKVAAACGVVIVSHSGQPDKLVTVRVKIPDDPIVSGLAPETRIAASPGRADAPSPVSRVLATADDMPVLELPLVQQGRIFRTDLGNNLAAMHEKLFITTFLRGAEWAATGKVTLGADLGPSQPATNAVRALLTTGGHEHESEFYSLFDGYKDLTWIPNQTSSNAFKQDLRSRYDVVIMYDFTRDLDDTCKRNLRAYVEAGGGVLVLHHALLSYEKWPWWFEEVSGGRYLLDTYEGRPASTYKGGREFFVTPAVPHPITANIGAFHLWDECYKGMWMSPRNRPLLYTDNPDSDHCIAWIGPCQTARVVCIQLGHGHTAFEHPAYRALVHNAILWVAGRDVPGAAATVTAP